MRLTKLVQTEHHGDDIRRIMRALNFHEIIVPFAALTAGFGGIGASRILFGGVVLDRSIFRQLLPDARWFLYAAGMASSDGTNPMTVELVYVKDDTTEISLGSTSVTSATATKLSMGPFDLFATAGVPPGETIPVVRLKAVKPAGAATGLLVAPWQIMLRLLPARQ